MNNKTNTNPPPQSQQQLFVSRRQLCARWGVSIDFLRQLEESRELTPIKLSPRCLRYKIAEIEAFESAKMNT